MGFSRQEYWSGLPFPSPGDLPNPGIKPRADALTSEPPGKLRLPLRVRRVIKKIVSQDYKFIYEEGGLKISKKCLIPLLFVRRNKNASIVLLIF